MDVKAQAKRAGYLKGAITRENKALLAETSSIERTKIARRIEKLRAELSPILAALGVTTAPVVVADPLPRDKAAEEIEMLRDALRRLVNESVHFRATKVGSQFLDLAIKNARQVLAR